MNERGIDPAQVGFWNSLGGRALEAADVEPYGIEYVLKPERWREVRRRYPCPTVVDAGHGIFGFAVGLLCVDDDNGRAIAYAPPVTVLRAALQQQAEILHHLEDALRQVAVIGDDPGADDATARESIVLVAGQALQMLDRSRPYPAQPPRQTTGFPTERRQRGLCPICGERIDLVGDTTDGRLIGSCQDAFTRTQWRSLSARLRRTLDDSSADSSH